ncbi:sodium:dicarboxylate cotransporter (permease SLC13 domain) [Campylobacter blaseri]|uniref:Transporter n=1 Tax=Campylobacter blaseri TaxID=2042961 RepID=A0A2P8R3N1_9BACT|nr:DASS family sodium-coupled anion symporter [Campylobacter blaseri]PSM53111.1 hypothetical protein CQ405_00745 [Campylobacter blaseri]PSM54577.1 hypothetical protein CRN67_00745 [Campylobacter blaseri]QKF86950.1 sodium:dicarboxylate cotransporter (permease SLC13 domain) [Campylobacter blaseri]
MLEKINFAPFKFIISLVFALIITFCPEYTDLNEKATLSLFILLFATGLWMSEAVPAFAVSLLVIFLNVILLGFNSFNFADSNSNWAVYLQPWGSPLVFLFFSGFIMGVAASKTRLDLWFTKKILYLVGDDPKHILTAILFITFIFSMFMSNTATTAMMFTAVMPIIHSLKKDDKFAKGLLLSIAVGANIGGMGTIIGTPPNAIAVGLLGETAPNFLEWMLYGAIPALIITFLLRFYLIKFYPTSQKHIDISCIADIAQFDDSIAKIKHSKIIPTWKKIMTVVTFFITVLLWLTGSIHNIPTSVVAFVPVIVFTIFGIIDMDDIRLVRWDVIILIVGGLSLGIAVSKSGLALWFANLFNFKDLSVIIFMLIFSYIIILISNFMSNTAAANIILPLVLAFSITFEQFDFIIIAVALSASLAMVLPISTPPNAIIFSTGIVKTKDFIKLGVIVALFAPIIVILWVYFLNTLI